ncbi:MAG: hypothetical protein HPY64_05460 [Anaerolineae bacterium]|nr:hypothetical protein [Anaerolineae bacterium]
MNRKATVIFLLTAMALVGVFVFSAGIAAAQGPRNGRGNNVTQTSLNQSGAAGLQLWTRQQLRDPLAPGAGAGAMHRWNGQNGQNGLRDPYATLPSFSGELPAEVADALLAGLADEYHAYAAYEAVIAQFGSVVPFVAIQQAEANHAAALERALTYYGVDYSAVTVETPEVTFGTLAEACAFAAEAEIANFQLYDNWLSTVSDYPDLVQIFTNLRNASEFNHLPAFQACAG